jgi:hypothetical protein
MKRSRDDHGSVSDGMSTVIVDDTFDDASG